MNAFNHLPSGAKSDVVAPYTVNISDSEVERMQTLLRLSNVAGPCYENSLPDGSRDLGIQREWLVEAKERWESNFNWWVYPYCRCET